MRRLLLLLILAAIMPVRAFAAYSWSAPGNTAGAATVTTSSATCANGTVTLLIVYGNSGSSLAATPVTDSSSNTWPTAAAATQVNGGFSAAVFVMPNATCGAGYTVTVHFTGTPAAAVIAVGNTGRATSSVVDQINSVVDTGYNESHPGASITTTVANDDVIGFIQTSNAADTFSAGSGFTIRAPSTANQAAGSESADSQATGTYSAAFTGTQYAQSIAFTVALKPAAATTHTQLFLIQPIAGLASPSGISGGGGAGTLLAYLAGGGASTYELSGQVIDFYSATPWDSVSNYKTTWASGVTVSSNTGSHVFDTGVLPALLNTFAISGPQCTSDGHGWNFNTSPATTSPSCAGNSAPNDWCTISQEINSSQSILDVVLLFPNPAGGGNDPWTYGGGVLNSGATQTQFLAWMDSYVVPCFITLSKPWILSPVGENNLGGGAYWGSGSNWTASNVATSAQVSALYALIQSHLISKGITNFLYNFESNLGVGNYTFGFNAGVFDLVSFDSNPTYLDSTAYNAATPSSGALSALGLPMFYGSMGVLSSGYPSAYAVNMYSYTGPSSSFLQQGIATSYPSLFGTLNWFQGQQYENQCGVGQALGVASTSFVTGTVSCSGDATSLTGDKWINANGNPASFSKAGGQAGG